MNAELLIDKVVGVIFDPAVGRDNILDYLNEAQVVVSGGGDRPAPFPLLAPLPDLLTSDTVTAAVDAVSVSLPTEHQRGVVTVVDASGDELEAVDYLEFMERYPVLETGSTEIYCVKGNTLYYAPAQAQDLTVHFHKLPTDLTDSASSFPTWLPSQFHVKTLVAYAVREIYDRKEDGIEGRKVNTDHWNRRFMDGLTDIERFIGPEEIQPEQVGDSADYIGDY